jgi:hypothetical protein
MTMLLKEITGQSKRAQISRAIVLTFLVANVAAYKLLGTTWGILLVSASAAWYLDNYTSLTVLSPSELLAELSNQPEIFLGVVGSVVAYFGLATWKDQKRTELSLQAGGEIQAFFKRAFDLAVDMDSFCEDYLELIEKIESGKTLEELHFDIDWLGQKISQVAASRQNLSKTVIEAHGIDAHYGAILRSKIFASHRLSNAVLALSKLADSMWGIHIPTYALDAKSIYEDAKNADQEKIKKYRAVFKKNAFQMLAYSGAVSGELAGRLFVPSILGTIQIIRNVRQLSMLPNPNE